MYDVITVCHALFFVHHLETQLFFLLLLRLSPFAAANMWFHLSTSEIRAERNRLMVISLSLPLFLFSLLTVAALDERTCIFCFSFRFHCPKKLHMWAVHHTYPKMLHWQTEQYWQTQREHRNDLWLLPFSLIHKIKSCFLVSFGRKAAGMKNKVIFGVHSQMSRPAEPAQPGHHFTDNTNMPFISLLTTFFCFLLVPQRVCCRLQRALLRLPCHLVSPSSHRF